MFSAIRASRPKDLRATRGRRVQGLRNMKVIHVIPGIAEEASGPNYSVTRLCEALLALGQDVTLATLDWGQRTKHLPYVNISPSAWAHVGWAARPRSRWLHSETATDSVDIVHNHGMWQMNAISKSCLVPPPGRMRFAEPDGLFPCNARRSYTSNAVRATRHQEDSAESGAKQ